LIDLATAWDRRPTMISLSMAGTCLWVGIYRKPGF
jgi:hypothetical protein